MSKHRTRTTGWDRLLSGVLCLALVLGLLPATGLIQPAKAAETEHWAYPYAQQLMQWGVMSELRLDDEITRAEFASMCNRAFGYNELGHTTFVDVPSSAWYAQVIDIAYTAGYFKGTSSDPAYLRASPDEPLTREQAAVMLARNLMLRETVGESLGFTDSRDLSEWSAGLIGAAVEEGMISGYADGSYRPFNNITRGEVAKMLVSVVGTLVYQGGSHELGSVYGNVTINSSHVTLRNTTIVGNLYITGGVDLGNVLLENVTVLGRIVVSGGGESDAAKSSVILRNVVADELVIDSMIDQFVTVSVYGYTDIPRTYVRSDAYLEDDSTPGYGLQYIEQDGATLLQLAGTIKEVLNKTPLSDLQLVKGTAQVITIDEKARGSTVLVAEGTLVYEMNLDVATLVTGKGDIKQLNIWAEECEVDILPEGVDIRPGISATVDGEKMGNLEAAELSSEPRLRAGYPNVTGIAPTQVQGQFAANKPGTIYWAVSELADGSVDEEDLINNPVYGSIIFAGQSGSIEVNAKEVYVQQITNLIPGGNYFLSAILVDGRGVRSPVKVVAFSTPDNTVPAFVGEPYMSKETCEIAQVTATANKDCVLYWALLTEGAAAPTPSEFKTGSLGGNYGYGSTPVVKNVPISIKVNRYNLPEKTTFWLYLWLTDENGVQSMAAPIYLEVHTPDETAPIVPAPIQTAYGESTAGITFSINEAPATLYWAVVAEGDETFISPSTDMTSLRTKIRVENGVGAIAASGPAGVPAAGANVDTLFTITGLDTAKTETNNYIMYYVAKDAAGNYSDRVGYIHIRTLDTDYPTVRREFTNVANNDPDQPLADTNIRLVFSEQVKGGSEPSTEISGNTPVTFLDFYNQVLAAGNAQTQRDARNRLAEELAEHIKLYYCPSTGSPYALTPLHELEKTPGANTENWVIDWRNAVITMDAEGQVIITLNSEGQNPALQLDSGATYYFQFLDVFDNAIKPNGLEDNRLGNYTMSRFTTVYAQVDFWQNTGVSKITGSSNSALNDIRLDIVVDISPRSTEKVPLSEYWDLIMWSENVMTVDIYRQVVEKDNESKVIEDWHQVRSNVIFTYAGSGKGLKEEEPSDSFETVKEGLEQGKIYRYGIHIKTLAGTEDDTDGKEEPKSWSALAAMRFSLIAGASGDVADVSRLVNIRTNEDTNYNNYLKRGAIKEIGTWNSPEDGPVNILRGTHQFRDSRAPSFMSIYPQFMPGSGSITMQVMLDRPGTVYYVVAPVKGGLGTSADGSTLIGLDNDGREGSTLVGKSYIPTGGNDIEAHKEYIQFISGGDTDEAKMYKSPDYLNQVYNVGKALTVEQAYKVEEVTITNLAPETEYYVYIVLEGGGDPSPVMQIYRVDTTKAQAPSVTVSGNAGNAIMTPSDDCLMYVVLVQQTKLDTLIKNLQPGQTTTYLEQMSTRSDPNSTTGPSVFDATASAAAKSAVAQYILSRNDSNLPNVELPNDDPNKDTKYPNGYVPANTVVKWDFNEDMDVDGGSYVVLVMVKQPRAGESGEDYGFGAFSGLTKLDDEPPTLFVNSDMKEGVVLLTQTKDQQKENATGVYKGTLNLLFNKDIFYWIGSNKYTLTYSKTDTDAKRGILNVVSGDIAVTTKKTSGDIVRSIDFEINQELSKNQKIILFEAGYLCNKDDYPAKMLVLTFDPEIPATEIFNSAVTDLVTYPGFRVSWG